MRNVQIAVCPQLLTDIGRLSDEKDLESPASCRCRKIFTQVEHDTQYQSIKHNRSESRRGLLVFGQLEQLLVVVRGLHQAALHGVVGREAQVPHNLLHDLNTNTKRTEVSSHPCRHQTKTLRARREDQVSWRSRRCWTELVSAKHANNLRLAPHRLPLERVVPDRRRVEDILVRPADLQVLSPVPIIPGGVYMKIRLGRTGLSKKKR